MVSRQWATAMTMPGLPITPSKTHRQENFPVASMLIAPQHRATILAYYRFARGADDVADSPSLAPDAKLARLDLFEATLTGRSEAVEAALPLRAALAGRKLSAASCARSAACLPDGCGQTSLRELVRVDGLLRLFGGASRAFRSRSAWRERIRPGRPRTRCARRFRLSTICKTAAPTIATSIAFMSRKMRLPRKASGQTPSTPQKPHRHYARFCKV